jgi:hypothetical protein
VTFDEFPITNDMGPRDAISRDVSLSISESTVSPRLRTSVHARPLTTRFTRFWPALSTVALAVGGAADEAVGATPGATEGVIAGATAGAATGAGL